MFKFFLKSFCLMFILSNVLFAQSNSVSDFLSGEKKTGQKAFANIDAFLAKNNSEFDNSEEIINLFNQERDRLGVEFESELWNYLGQNLPKHYWISAFVEAEDYLQGNKALPELAFKIREKAVLIPVANDDYPLLGMKFTLLRQLVVNYYLAGKRDLAIANKRKAEAIYKEIKDLGVVGADTEFVFCVYDNLEKNPGSCKEEKSVSATENNDSGEEISQSGVLNGKAILMPAPEYPKAARAVGATGAVNIEVVINETGKVIEARPVSGHKLLIESALEAAKQAKFSPTLQNGRPVKVKGIIVYNFSK